MDDAPPGPAAAPGRGCAYQLLVLTNLGLLASILLAATTFLPIDLPLIDTGDLRFFSGVAVVVFLDASFWLSGWPGSGLGVTLMGMALLLVMLMGEILGIVALALAVLIAAMVLLLMLSDLPLAHERGWSRRPLSIGIGLVANLVVAVIVALLLRTFGRFPGL